MAAGVIRTMAPYLPMAPMLARAVEADGGLARGLDDNAEPVVEGEAEEATGDGTDIEPSEHVQARDYPRPSLTCTVLDRVFAHREVRAFRTEAGQHGQRGQVRKRAAAEAARLNASAR